MRYQHNENTSFSKCLQLTTFVSQNTMKFITVWPI